MSAPDTAALAGAAEAVDLAQHLVDSACASIRGRGGIDANQVVAYDVAHAAAAVATARSTLQYGERGEVEAAIAAAFVADVVADLAGKVAGREALWGVEADWAAPAADFLEAHRDPAVLAALAATEGPRHLGEDFELVRETFHRFAEDKVRPHAEHVHRANADIPEEVIEGLAELGGFGLSVPEEYGGFATGGESDYMGMVVATEELSWGSLGVGGSLITRPEILTRALVYGGTEEQKKHWLPKLASAEILAAVAVTEPDYGSDVANIVTSATPVDGGWVINGVKTWCTFAARADVLMLLARTDPDRSLAHRGISMFVVEKPRGDGHGFVFTQGADDVAERPADLAPGKLEGRPIDTLGYRGMHSYELAFENWFVPEANLVGGPDGLGKGFYLQMQGFENGRLQTAARALGVMQAAYEAAVGLRSRTRRVRLAHRRLPADAGEVGADGGVDPGDAPERVPRGPPDGAGRGSARGLHGQGVRVPRRRVGHARGHADPRRHGLRGGVSRQPLLRRRAGALHLRRRRRDAGAQGHRSAPHRLSPASACPSGASRRSA